MNDPDKLKNLALQHYSNLYTTDGTAGGSFVVGDFPQMSGEVRGRMEKQFTASEIYGALMEMGALKASGPDGFHVVFFQKTWGVVGNSEALFVKQILEGGQFRKNISEALVVTHSQDREPHSYHTVSTN